MFIVIEGLDGAGKSTQVGLMRRLLAERYGKTVEYLHFPRFDAPVYGDLVARFLRGELGALDEVNPYLVALIYAGDRQQAAPLIRSWQADGKAVIVDRYVYSNIAYQCAKLPPEILSGERNALKHWILDL
ncbi:nucleoside/nucleotide kinase family protein, partial [Rikenella microfusus]